MTLSGVTLSGDFYPCGEWTLISGLSMLALGNTSGGVTNVSIINSEFLLPEVGPVNHLTTVVGVRVIGSLSSQSDDDLTILNFKKQSRCIQRLQQGRWSVDFSCGGDHWACKA